MNTWTVNTPLGRLCLREDADVLIGAAFDEARKEEQAPSALLLEAHRQLDAYFKGELHKFDLPMNARGTDFELSVWRLLRDIPYGSTRTYKELAEMLGKPGAARAVGRACGKNPLLVFVPCHRVIGASGKLTGFAAGVERKRMLLDLEQRNR